MDIVGVAQRSWNGHRRGIGDLGDFAEPGNDARCSFSALVQPCVEFLALENVCELGQQLFREAKDPVASEQRIHKARCRTGPGGPGNQNVRVNDQLHARVARL